MAPEPCYLSAEARHMHVVGNTSEEQLQGRETNLGLKSRQPNPAVLAQTSGDSFELCVCCAGALYTAHAAERIWAVRDFSAAATESSFAPSPPPSCSHEGACESQVGFGTPQWQCLCAVVSLLHLSA